MSRLEFDDSEADGKYKVEVICNSVVYIKELEGDQLPGLYYLVLWKGYPEEENTWELVLVIQHLWRLVIIFHREYPGKPMAILPSIDETLSRAKPTAKSLTKVRPTS